MVLVLGTTFTLGTRGSTGPVPYREAGLVASGPAKRVVLWAQLLSFIVRG
jgi:hypothetical protein